jgi:hypothetical protein
MDYRPYIERAIRKLQAEAAWHAECSYCRSVSDDFYYTYGASKRDRHYAEALRHTIANLRQLLA